MALVRELLAQVGCVFGAGRGLHGAGLLKVRGPAPQNVILRLRMAQVGYEITDLRHARAFRARKVP